MNRVINELDIDPKCVLLFSTNISEQLPKIVQLCDQIDSGEVKVWSADP